MPRETFLSLPWLPEPAAEFVAMCRDIPRPGAVVGQTLQGLATARLNAAQSARLSRAIRKCREAGADLAPLSPFRLGILASATLDLVVDCLPAAAARHGVALEITGAAYGQVMQDALDPTSAVNSARLDAVLIAVDHRWLGLDKPTLAGDPANLVSQALASLRAVTEGLRANGGAPAILQTLAQPPAALFGSFDRRWRGSVRAMIESANAAIVALAEETGSYLLDVAALAEQAGTELWFDPVHWLTYKLPFAAECVPAYCDLIGRLLGAIRGKARKCLVLDLDNTLWGGVIGDDGVEGIVLGQGSAKGEAFLAVHHAALDLRARGVILAACSKNDDAVARRALREHPEMALREEHFSAFQANWLDKASNLETIARSLNIGLDALVMLDDNPAERALIRAALPMVAVPELPNDPSHYARYLAWAGYFESIAYSAEDAGRAQSYAADAMRAEIRSGAGNIDEYLSSLAMNIRFAPFDAKGRQRIAQLINKTNQFNLTTRRYSAAEVSAMEEDESVFTLQVHLEDRFGDLGMIGVVICRAAGEEWDIDTWLMSCRVLGRRVEQAVLAQIARAARRRGALRLVGTYIPTSKNAMVKDHYERLGFASSGAGRFVLTLADFTEPELPFTVAGER